jgi:serine/threonine protein kinase
VFLTARHINIVMDYANYGSLLGYLQLYGQLQEAVARWFFQQLVLAVDYCHKKGVCLRDIKLENTLLHLPKGRQWPLVRVRAGLVGLHLLRVAFDVGVHCSWVQRWLGGAVRGVRVRGALGSC